MDHNNSSSNLDLSVNPNYLQGKSRTKDKYIVSMGSPTAPEANSQRREIGDLAVWTLSSAKPGNGVEQLRDDSVSTFW